MGFYTQHILNSFLQETLGRQRLCEGGLVDIVRLGRARNHLGDDVVGGGRRGGDVVPIVVIGGDEPGRGSLLEERLNGGG